MSLKIREVKTQKEIKIIWDLFYTVLRKPFKRKRYNTKEQNEPYKFFAAILEEQIVGAISLVKNKSFHIGSLAILPKKQNKGIGSALLQMLLNDAERLGYNKVEVSSYDEALDFYKKHGFKAKGKRTDHGTYALTPMVYCIK